MLRSRWGNDLHAFRQQDIVQFVDLPVQRLQRRIRFRSFAQKHDAFHHVVIVKDSSILMADGFAELSQPDLGSLDDHTQITHSNRRAIHGFDHGGANIVRASHHSDGPYVECLLSPLYETPACIEIVVGQRLLDLTYGKTVRNQFAGIELDLVFPRGPTENVDRDNVGHRFQLVPDIPSCSVLSSITSYFGLVLLSVKT